MSSPLTKRLFAALLSLGALAISGCDPSGGGGTPAFVPEISGFNLDVATINVGTAQKATMTISVTPGATVTNVDYEATPINGNIPLAGFRVDNAPVTNYQFDISPNPYVPDTTWGISQLKVTTSKYIYSYLGDPSGTYLIEVTDLAGAPAGNLKTNETAIAIKELATTGGTLDTVFPQITSVSVTPSPHTFVPGDTVTLTVGVSETGSGIGISNMANLSPKYAGSPNQNMKLNIVDATTLRGQLVLSNSMDAIPLDLSFFYIAVGDAAGNLTYLSLDPAFGPNYIDSSGLATIAASAGAVPFAFTPLSSRTAANGSGWTAPDGSLSGYHTVTTVSDSTIMDVFNVTGGTTALHFQADTGSPSSANSSTPSGGGAYSAKWPTFGFFWEDGTVATGGLEPATSPVALYGISSDYYNPGIRITPVGAHTKLYVFCFTGSTTAGTLSEKAY